MRNQVIRVKKELEEDGKITESTTIFYDVLTSDQVRPEEKTTAHLADEGNINLKQIVLLCSISSTGSTLMAAGTITTAHTLAVLTFHVLSNPHILQRLQAELGTVMVGKELPTWHKLEQLEYLVRTFCLGWIPCPGHWKLTAA